MQTAEIIGAKTRHWTSLLSRMSRNTISARLSPASPGTRSGSAHPEIIEAFRKDDSEFPRYPGEEGRAAFQERVRSAYREIAERHQRR